MENITKYRTELMGIAILWVVLFHLPDLTKNASFLDSLIMFIQSIGYAGVDIFFFLSGFGLTFGWLRKQYKVSEFYQRRILRILPTYWLWMFLLCIGQITITRDFKVRGWIADLFGIGFLANKSYNHWFIPSIIICYLIFPLLIRLIEKTCENSKINSTRILLLSILPPLIISLALILIGANNLLIFSTRLPNFILGCFIAYFYLNRNENKINGKLFSFSLLALMFGIGSFLLYLTYTLTTNDLRQTYGLWWYPFIFLTFPLCLTLASLMDWTKINTPIFIISPLMALLRFCGKYSLEIYLMHGLLFGLMGHEKSSFGLLLITRLGGSQISFIFYYFLLILFSFASAYCLRHSVKSLTSKLIPIRAA
jgi:peptidoglycan/LPS O-acetylase OafA/YrhL